MKKSGSIQEFKEARDRELLASFRHVLATAQGVPLREMYGMAARRPCSRFWVSEERASEVMSRMMQGKDDEKMRPQRRRMYDEIRKRVDRKLREEPGMPLCHAVGEVVNSPAPEFYLTDSSALVIISRLRHARRK